MKRTAFIILTCVPFIVHTQNLVLNPGFELYHCDPWYISSIEDCNNWTSPTMSSPDYFNNSCLERGTSAIPQKYWGFQLPESGNSYMGIIAYDYRKQNRAEAGAEYIQGSLSQPLKANEKYAIEFYVSLAECSKLTLQDLGVFFSENITKEKTVDLLKRTPQVTTHICIADTCNWISINETYTAKGNEKYFIIGCFNNGKKIKFKKVDPSKNISDPRDYAYYFIDNVTIKPEIENPVSKTETQTIGKDTIKPNSPHIQIDVGKSFVLNNISFTAGSYELAAVSFTELDKLVERMNKNPALEILISGHTDNNGDKKNNLDLSKQRAKSVLTYLVSKGIPEARIAYDGYGDTKPIASNETEAGRKVNRRVEITVTKQ